MSTGVTPTPQHERIQNICTFSGTLRFDFIHETEVNFSDLEVVFTYLYGTRAENTFRSQFINQQLRQFLEEVLVFPDVQYFLIFPGYLVGGFVTGVHVCAHMSYNYAVRVL